MSTLQFLVSSFMMFLGSTVLSTVGFGIGMVSMPGLVLVLEPQSAVVMMNTVAFGLEAWIVWHARHDLPLKEMLPIALAGALGVPIAVFILSSANASALRVSISVLIIILAATTAFNYRGQVPYPKLLGPLAGFVVGVVLPALGVGGPLVTLFLLTRKMTPKALRVSMAFYLLVLDTFAIGGYATAGLYNQERMILIGVVIVPVLIGLWLGGRLLRRMNERVFRYAAIGIIIISSLMVLGRELLYFA